MRATFLLGAAIALTAATSASAQVTKVVEPVQPSLTEILNAPITYDENGVVKAQHFKASDLTPEQYQALLAEADRVRGYQDYTGANAVVSAPETSVSYGTVQDSYTQDTYVQDTYVQDSYSYETAQPIDIQLFETTPATVSYMDTTVVTQTHVIAKGDTLYNISKRYNTTVDALKSKNAMTSNALSIGQVITLPATEQITSSTYNSTVAQPVFASAPIVENNVTRRIVQPVSTGVAAVYAVLPKDTLYSISRRSCVSVSDLISANNIASPNAIKPGDRLSMPAGHCLK